MDDVGDGFGYNDSSDGSGANGIFLSLTHGNAKLQIKSDLGSSAIKVRSRNFSEWFPWREL